MQLTPKIKLALRRKRAGLNWTISKTADSIGIDRITYGRLEKDDYTKIVYNGTYRKLTEWLAKDY